MESDVRVIDICDDDLNVTEKWLVKVSIIEEEYVQSEGEYIKKTLVLELIQRFAPDEEMILGYEVSKLPILCLPKELQTRLERVGDLRIKEINKKGCCSVWA